MPFKRFVLLTLPPLAVLGLMAWGVLAQPPTPLLGALPAASPPPCESPARWAVLGDQARPATSRLGATGWRWWTAGVLSAAVCGPGTLTIAGSGRVFRGAAPEIMVLLGDREIGREAFDGQRTVQIMVPAAGEVHLMFGNALDLVEGTRALDFEGLSFTLR